MTISNHRMRLLSLTLASAFFAGAAQAQTVPELAAPPVVSAPPVVTVEPVVQGDPGASVLAPPTTTPGTSAVNALQQDIAGQQTAAPAPTGPSAPSSTGTALEIDMSDESTLLREVAKYQSRLAILKLLGEIEKGQMDIQRERMKFEQDQREAEGGGQDALPTMGGPAAAAGAPSPAGAQAPVVPVEAEEPMPTLRSVYSFDGVVYAEVVSEGLKRVVTVGDELPNGDRVVSIGSNKIVVSRKGKKTSVDLGAASAAPTTITGVPPIPGA